MSKHVIVFSRDRLSASDMLQVRKVMEHVYEKIINLDNESQTTSSSNNEKPEQEKEEDIAVLAEEKIELLCQDQVSGPEEHSFVSLQRYSESHLTCAQILKLLASRGIGFQRLSRAQCLLERFFSTPEAPLQLRERLRKRTQIYRCPQ